MGYLSFMLGMGKVAVTTSVSPCDFTRAPVSQRQRMFTSAKSFDLLAKGKVTSGPTAHTLCLSGSSTSIGSPPGSTNSASWSFVSFHSTYYAIPTLAPPPMKDFPMPPSSVRI